MYFLLIQIQAMHIFYYQERISKYYKNPSNNYRRTLIRICHSLFLRKKHVSMGSFVHPSLPPQFLRGCPALAKWAVLGYGLFLIFMKTSLQSTEKFRWRSRKFDLSQRPGSDNWRNSLVLPGIGGSRWGEVRELEPPPDLLKYAHLGRIFPIPH